MTAAWTAARRLLYAGFVLTLVVLAAALATAVAPRLFGYGVLVVAGGSMGSDIPRGSLVLSSAMPAEDVVIGDVIVFREPGSDSAAPAKIHRVVEVQRSGGETAVRTKGDANPDPDPKLYVLPDRVVTPAYTIPYLGHLVAFVQTPLGWALSVLLPAVVLSIIALRAIWSDPQPKPTAVVRPKGDPPHVLALMGAAVIGLGSAAAALGLLAAADAPAGPTPSPAAQTGRPTATRDVDRHTPAPDSGSDVDGRALGAAESPLRSSASLAAAGDSFVDHDRPTTSFGAAATMEVRAGETSSAERALVRFDTSLIPAGSTVAQAVLTLCATAVPPVWRTYGVHRLTASWAETSLTWSNQPGIAGAVTAATTTPLSPRCMSWTVTSDVQAWVDGVPNNGWRISDATEQAATPYFATFSTRENAATLGPTLDVIYSVPEPR